MRYSIGMALLIRRDGHEQKVTISESSYANNEGVMQFVLYDPEKKWDVCRGSASELDQVFVRELCRLCLGEMVAGHDHLCSKCWTGRASR